MSCVKKMIPHAIGGVLFGLGVAIMAYAGWHPASFTEGGLATLLQLNPEYRMQVFCLSGVGAAIIYWSLRVFIACCVCKPDAECCK